MGPERKEKSKFTKEESEEIGKAAIQLAGAGEEAIWEVVVEKNKLFAKTIKMLQGSYSQPNALKGTRALKHEVDIMQEVADRAFSILQREGKDEGSKCRKKLEKEELRQAFGYLNNQNKKDGKVGL